MNEKRFEVINARWQGKGEAVSFEDTQTNQVYFAENQEECERIVDLLNEQQDIINELQSIINHCERKTGSGKKMKSEEPVYYNSNGLSPNRAFEQGLISKEEFIGFIKGNIIKYVVRCGKKGNPIEDIDKAIDYLHLLKKIMRFDDDSKMVIDDE